MITTSRPTPPAAPVLASELRRHAHARVLELLGTPDKVERLSAMGLAAGARFRVLHPAPTLTVRVEGTSLALGTEWAASLSVVEL